MNNWSFRSLAEPKHLFICFAMGDSSMKFVRGFFLQNKMLFFPFTAKSGSNSFLFVVQGHRKHLFKILISLCLRLDFKRRVMFAQGTRSASLL